MTLRFLGTGGAFSRQYGTTCSLMTARSGERWLIDCGRQAPDQLWDAGLDWHDIDGQIVTHVHGDHIFGLEDFAFQRYYQAAPAAGQAAPAAGQAAPAAIMTGSSGSATRRAIRS
jgi:ribonuclease BN (tRNA processing enzyme)